MVPLEDIFCFIDDFCKTFQAAHRSNILPNPDRKRQRPCALALSEIMTIMVLFHLSHYRTFKDFYTHALCVHFRKDFPKLVSYNRFLELMPLAAMPLYVLASRLRGQETGKYYADSTKLQVCDNLRIKNHKVFKDIAKLGKTSTGWFFGFKLHLVINHKGEIMGFKLTPGNTDDRKGLEKLITGLKGWLFGDKGYISQPLLEKLKKQGLELITRGRKNMKKQYISKIKKQWLDKRGLIESVIEQLKSICHIQHTRHRSAKNFVTNLMAGVLAYILKPKKPNVSFHQHITQELILTSS